MTPEPLPPPAVAALLQSAAAMIRFSLPSPS